MMKKYGLLFIAFIASAMLLSSCAQKAFYYPDHAHYGSPTESGLPYEEVWFHSADGTQLHGWFVPARGVDNPKNALGTVVHFHGNAQNLTAHWHGVKWLPEQGFNVFLFDYRGYGQSENKSPNQQALFDDSNAALNYVRQRADIDKDKLLIFGQSLGGTNAIAVVGAGNRVGVKAVAIEATFASYSAIAHEKIWGAGVLFRNRYSAQNHVAHIAPIPLLFLHGTHDTVIGQHHSQTLFNLAGEPKQLMVIQGGGHLNLADATPDYPHILTRFFKQHL